MALTLAGRPEVVTEANGKVGEFVGISLGNKLPTDKDLANGPLVPGVTTAALLHGLWHWVASVLPPDKALRFGAASKL